jgi:hypothetical protein
VLLVGCHRQKDSDLTVNQWNELVGHSLPAGSSRADVEKFLDQHGIEHSFIEKSNFSEEANTMVALVKNEDDHGVVRKSGTQLKFKFDTNQRLVSSEGREVFTGP